MRFEPQQFDEERGATALRAFLVTLLFSLIALWAFGGASGPPHGHGLDGRPFEQGAKLAAAGNQRALAVRLERAKPRQHPALDLSSPPTLAEARVVAAPMRSGRASWTPDAFAGPDNEAHPYFATGPPGRQLS
jgi:hypothetical protein